MKTSILAAAIVTCCTLSAPGVFAQGMSAPTDLMMGGPRNPTSPPDAIILVWNIAVHTSPEEPVSYPLPY